MEGKGTEMKHPDEEEPGERLHTVSHGFCKPAHSCGASPGRRAKEDRDVNFLRGTLGRRQFFRGVLGGAGESSAGMPLRSEVQVLRGEVRTGSAFSMWQTLGGCLPAQGSVEG